MRFELDVSPVSVRLVLTRDEYPREGSGVVCKHVACVEEFLVEKLRKAKRTREFCLSVRGRGGERGPLTSRSFSFVKRHSFVHVLRKLS